MSADEGTDGTADGVTDGTAGGTAGATAGGAADKGYGRKEGIESRQLCVTIRSASLELLTPETKRWEYRTE